MRKVVVKSLVVGLLSLAATLAIALVVNPLLGGELAGAGLVVSIVCPLAISIPASGVHFYQQERLKQAQAETCKAREEIELLYHELQRQAIRDDLTGTLNRNAFFSAIGLASRNGLAGAVLFIDVDHFKRVNDQFGHAVGDQALRTVGNILLNHAGADKIVGRLGGEEFAMFLEEIDAGEATSAAEAIRMSVEHTSLIARSGTRVPITISIGVTFCPTGFDHEEVLAAADAKLYEAKQSGRNRVVC